MLLHVENGQFEAVVIQLMRGPVPLRVGVVDGLAACTLRIPEAYLGLGTELSLRAESTISHHAQNSPRFEIEGGQTIRWVVHGAHTLSTFSVR